MMGRPSGEAFVEFVSNDEAPSLSNNELHLALASLHLDHVSTGR